MLAIDIGTGVIKIINSETGTRGIIESPTTLQSSILAPDEERIAEYIRQLTEGIGDKSYNNSEAVAALPTFASIFAPNEYQETYRRIFQKAGMKLMGLVPEGEALARAFNKTHSALIVDMGDRATNFFLVKNGRVARMSQTDFAVQSFYKNNAIPTFAAGEVGVHTSDGVWNVIIGECSRVMRMTVNNADNLIVVGGGANIEGVSEFFSAKLQLPLYKYEGDPQFAVVEGLLR